MSWYYVNRDGFTVGPKTVAQLKPLYAARTINDKTFIWNGTTVDTWTTLKDVKSVYNVVVPYKRIKSRSSHNKNKNNKRRHYQRSKSTTKLSVMSRLSSNKKSASTTSRFASLKPSSSSNKNKNNDQRTQTQAQTQRHTQTKSRDHHKSASTTKPLNPTTTTSTNNSDNTNHNNNNNNNNNHELEFMNREPSTSYSVTSFSSEMAIKRGSGLPDRATNHGHSAVQRPPSLSSINFSTSTAKRTKFLQSKSQNNLLRAHPVEPDAPKLYSSVSADDIDTILDEIENNEKNQNQTAKEIKNKLSTPRSPKKTSYTERILSLIKRDRDSSKSKKNKKNKARKGSDPDEVNINWNEVSNVQIQSENIDAIRRIITKQPNIDINTQNPRDGTTLLIHSVMIGDLDLVLELLRYGADHKIKDHDGDDAIDYALIFQRYKITELLLMVDKGLNNKRVKEIIRKKERECKYMAANTFGRFKDNIIDFICTAMQNKGVIEENMLFMAWYFTVHSENKVTGNDRHPHVLESKLFKTMMKIYGDAMRNKRKDKKTWKWIRKYLIENIIWLLPHPDAQYNDNNDNDKNKNKNKNKNIDESDDDETDDDDDEEEEEEESKTTTSERKRLSNQSLTVSSVFNNHRGYGIHSTTSQPSVGLYYNNNQLIAIEESQDEYDQYCANSVGLSNKLVHLVKIDQFLNIEINNFGEDKLLLFLFL